MTPEGTATASRARELIELPVKTLYAEDRVADEVRLRYVALRSGWVLRTLVVSPRMRVRDRPGQMEGVAVTFDQKLALTNADLPKPIVQRLHIDGFD
jgi:hypothetical protein